MSDNLPPGYDHSRIERGLAQAARGEGADAAEVLEEALQPLREVLSPLEFAEWWLGHRWGNLEFLRAMSAPPEVLAVEERLCAEARAELRRLRRC